MEKIDLKKELAWYKARHGVFDLVDVPTVRYLMIDGKGDPNTGTEFTAATEALYPVAYKIKFASKKALGKDYGVMPLEGLWWAHDMSVYTSRTDRSDWLWTLMIMQPSWVTESMVEEAISTAAAKNAPPALSRIRFEELTEGSSVQTLHVGSYADEGPVIEAMHRDYMVQHGLIPTGKHHEVYFSDARKVEPAKLRTILRQPVQST